MTREIKFRAWVKECKSMIGHREVIERSHLLFEDSLNSSDIVMQYVGVEDKDGTKIYEGDIVKSKSNHHFVIDFQYGSFGATWLEDDSVWYSCATCPFDEKGFIIIGNIYEHEMTKTLEERVSQLKKKIENADFEPYDLTEKLEESLEIINDLQATIEEQKTMKENIKVNIVTHIPSDRLP